MGVYRCQYTVQENSWIGGGALIDIFSPFKLAFTEVKSCSHFSNLEEETEAWWSSTTA